MRSQQPVTFAGIFGAGLNLDTQPYLLAEGEARDCLNVVSTFRGSIRKRDGSQQFATAGTNLTGLHASENPAFLVAAGGTVLYSVAPNGTVSTIKTGMTNGALWSFVNAPASGSQGPVWGTNGTDLQQWTGSGNTAAWTAATGNPPTSARFLTYAGNRVWAAGFTTLSTVVDPGSAVVWSNLADPRDWPSDNVVLFDPNDGEAITAIGRCGAYVLVAKPSKLWVIYDLDLGANRPIGTNVGCVAHRSMVETPAGCFFLGRDELYLTDGNQVRSVSKNRVSSIPRSIAQGNRQLATGVFFDGHYYLAYSTSGSTNNRVLDYDTNLDSFWVHALTAAGLAVWEGAGTRRIFAARTGNAIDQLFVPGLHTDDGSAFAGSWSSPFYTFGAPQLRKRVWKIHFDGTGRIQTSVAKDFATAGALASDVNFTGNVETFGAGTGVFGRGTETFGGASTVGEAAILTPGVGRAWSVTFGNDTDDPFEIDSMTFELADRPRKGLV